MKLEDKNGRDFQRAGKIRRSERSEVDKSELSNFKRWLKRIALKYGPFLILILIIYGYLYSQADRVNLPPESKPVNKSNPAAVKKQNPVVPATNQNQPEYFATLDVAINSIFSFEKDVGIYKYLYEKEDYQKMITANDTYAFIVARNQAIRKEKWFTDEKIVSYIHVVWYSSDLNKFLILAELNGLGVHFLLIQKEPRNIKKFPYLIDEKDPLDYYTCYGRKNSGGRDIFSKGTTCINNLVIDNKVLVRREIWIWGIFNIETDTLQKIENGSDPTFQTDFKPEYLTWSDFNEITGGEKGSFKLTDPFAWVYFDNGRYFTLTHKGIRCYDINKGMIVEDILNPPNLVFRYQYHWANTPVYCGADYDQRKILLWNNWAEKPNFFIFNCDTFEYEISCLGETTKGLAVYDYFPYIWLFKNKEIKFITKTEVTEELEKYDLFTAWTSDLNCKTPVRGASSRSVYDLWNRVRKE